MSSELVGEPRAQRRAIAVPVLDALEPRIALGVVGTQDLQEIKRSGHMVKALHCECQSAAARAVRERLDVSAARDSAPSRNSMSSPHVATAPRRSRDGLAD